MRFIHELCIQWICFPPQATCALFYWLFVWSFSSLENFSLETSPLPVKGCKFDLCPALMAIEQWGFFSVPHLLWHGALIYNGHIQDPWHSHLMPSVWQWSCHYLFFNDLGVSPRSNQQRNRRGCSVLCVLVELNGFLDTQSYCMITIVSSVQKKIKVMIWVSETCFLCMFIVSLHISTQCLLLLIWSS